MACTLHRLLNLKTLSLKRISISYLQINITQIYNFINKYNDIFSKVINRESVNKYILLHNYI